MENGEFGTGEFRRLFIHRDDVYAVQRDDGSYNPVRRPLEDDDLADHLNGYVTYGAYVMKPGENTVKYAVFDLDTLDENADTFLNICLKRLVPAEHSNAVVREFSGSKGWHYWLFFDEPVAAGKVRAWVEQNFMDLWAPAAEEHGWHLDFFPRQDYVPDGGFGNLVKLPLGIHNKSGKWSTIEPSHPWADGLTSVVPYPVALLPEIAPRKPKFAASSGVGPGVGFFPCLSKIVNEGVDEGNRKLAMFSVALFLFQTGFITVEQAFDICSEANERFNPPLSLAELRDAVHSAYSGKYKGGSCRSDVLRNNCPDPNCTGRSPLRRDSIADMTEGGFAWVRVEPEADGQRKRVRYARLYHPDFKNAPRAQVEEG